MSTNKKNLSRWYAIRIFTVGLACALITACEHQASPIPTATQVPPTATGTPEATSTDTPVPTPTITPTPEAPQAISNFVDDLPGEFSFAWSLQTKPWDLNHHLTVQLTETQTQVTDQTVARFSADGTQMTINVKGEDVQLPVTNFGQSADQSGAESGSYQLIPGADVKTGIGFTLGVKDSVDGRVAYGYNVWGKWVENKDYQVGRLEVNDFNLFAGALQINPDRADDIYQGLVSGIYNIQIVTGNQAILDKYPTPEAFLQAAQSGTEFTDLTMPIPAPAGAVANVYNRLATVETVDRMRLDTIRLGFEEQSYDRILHPTDPYRSFIAYHYYDYVGAVGQVRIATPEEDELSSLALTLGRMKLISPYQCYDPFIIKSPLDQLRGTANQLLESWIYTLNTLPLLDRIDVYRTQEQVSHLVDYPVMFLYAPLDPISISDQDACDLYDVWRESDVVQLSR